MLVTSKGILNIPGLSSLVDEPVNYYLRPQKSRYLVQNSCQKVAGWGRKNSFFNAKTYAEKHHLQLVCLEDGFIRSLGLGKEGYPPLSIVIDQLGIYFDATQPSDLENLIALHENQKQNERAEQLIQDILKLKITKYNLKYCELEQTRFQSQQNILVVDQTYGDQSIQYSGATAATFQQMLDTAFHQHPEAIIWLKIHPDVIAGKAKGYFAPAQLNDPRLRFCTENYHPIELLEHMDEVYVVSSQLGFEALLCGKKVNCFGLPWYAGWGLTNDDHAPVSLLSGRRQVHRSLAHLFASAYLHYARYLSPVTQQRCELEQIIQLLKPNLVIQRKMPAEVVCYGFSRWKKKFIRDFIQFPKAQLQFQSLFKPAKQETIFAWGKKAGLLKNQYYPQVWTVEDGFIRSSGLGANLVRPYSLVFDDVGIYYDATQPSRLEDILNHIQLDPQQIQRSQRLIESLKQLAITKYNVGQRQPLQRPEKVEKVILVTGQVEDDLSVQLGGVGVKTNLALLQQVRMLNPKAYIIYKPHPDVHAGLRLGQIHAHVVSRYADELQLEASVLECFAISDELHTITSLSGFEALLRGLKVYCYGLPFYAGWGLTTDLYNCKRRCKQLTLHELVHGVLIDYASYNLPQTAIFRVPRVNVEDVIQQLVIERQLGVSSPILQSTFAKIRAKILHRNKV